MLCDCDIKDKGLYFKMTLQRDNRVNISALFRARHKVSEVANFVGMSRTTVYSIKKPIDSCAGVNRCAGSGRKTVVDCDSLRDAIRSSPRTFIRQHARIVEVGAATVPLAFAKLRTN